ncbi:MAG: MBL fold metallo-hydrolase [Lyngbya sp.]|nr:MBL fold metallo-hydrolase [Lyngbya sp.]
MLRMGPHRILLDCGLQDISPLLAASVGSPPADLVFCSHAHGDHAVGLLALHQAFPQLAIYASEVTAQLLPLNWPEFSPQEVPQFCQPLSWKSEIELRKGLSATLFPAGHLPGAAAILLKYDAPERTYRLLYTGDFFLSNSRLVEGLPLGELRGLKPDVLILEGSYGTARHPHRRQLENQLAERIERALTAGYSVLFPTPPLGLGQELLMLLRSHHYFTGRDIDIWVDSQVAQGCDIYLQLLPYFPTSVQNFAQHQPLFWDERIRPRVRRLTPEQNPALSESPCVVIAENQTFWPQYTASSSQSWVLFLPERPGTALKIPPEVESQFGRVETYLLSQHSDGAGTTQLIHNVRPQHVIFVHGSPLYLADLANLDELRNRYQLHYPSGGTLLELPIGETFIQPAMPETHYEAEVTELATEINIVISQSITTDPRWPSFADTGLVEVRWQGEELVLRGISQRELLNQASDLVLPLELECCGNCLYYRGQRCSNPSSAFYNFKVTPDGACPVFEPSQELGDGD